MAKKKNEDMAGIVSEPGNGAPEVRPAKSLWPRPHEEVRIEPSLEPPQIEDAPVEAPLAAVPEGDFDTVPSEGYQEPPAEPVVPEAEPEPVSEPDPEPVSEIEPAIEELASVGQPHPPVFVGEPAPQPDPQPIRVREDERTAAVFVAADHQKPALADPGEGKAGRLIAMAAGIVVALALGAVAFVYGASGLGLKFGKGGGETAEAVPPPPPPPVAAADPEELKAAQDRVKELEERLKALEEKAAAAAQPEPQPQPEPQEQPAPRPQEKTAAIPPVEPAPEPAPAPEPVRETPPPAASAPEPAPQPAPVAETPPPPPPKPVTRQPETARVEPEPPPPPQYNVQPSYGRQNGNPEMPVLRDWAVRDVYNGIAVVQGGRGAPLEVEPGDELPGGNRVLAIRRLGGNWAVVTEQGIIAGY